MTKTIHTDVLIVGAGPIGAYLGWKLADAGCDVHLLEALTLDKVGAHIEVIHIDEIRFDEFEIPHPTPPALIHLPPFFKVWSVDSSRYFEVHYPFYVINMPLYVQRLHGYIRNAGGKLTEKARVEDVIVEDGYIKGVTGNIGGEPFEAYARITVDASGIVGALRTRLPDDFGIENTPLPPEQTFYSGLELREDIPEGYPTGSNSFLGTPGFWNMSYGDGAILGMVIPGSAELAWEKHKQWREERYGDPGKLVARRIGCGPYRRAPLSYVGDGFVAVGDSVYQNKAFSGEGIVSGYTACKIAKDVIFDALEKDDCSKKGLWAYNTRYFRGQGAKFASVMGFLPIVNDFPPEELDFLNTNEIIFCKDDYEYLNLNYELNLPTERWARICQTIEAGVKEGKFSEKSFQTMKTLYDFSNQLKAHYLEYPETPDGIAAWGAVQKAMWGY